MRAVPFALVGAALVASAAHAAAKPSPADVVAEALVEEARALPGGPESEAARERIRMAYETSGRAAYGLLLARSFARAGSWLTAIRVYRATSTTPVDGKAPAGEAEAVEAARVELGQLLERLPRLTIALGPGTPRSVRLLLDGKPIAPNTPLQVLPGRHTVDASADGYHSRQIPITVAERDRTRIPLDLPPVEQAAPAAPAAESGPSDETAERKTVLRALPPLRHGAAASDPEPADEETSGPVGSGQRLLGYMMIGWGAAGLVGGGVTAYLAGQKDPGEEQDRLRLISTVSLAGGAGLAGIGLVVVLTAPSGASRSALLGPPAGVLVTGAF